MKLRKVSFLLICLLTAIIATNAQQTLFVATDGSDSNNGTKEAPLASIQTAITKAGAMKGSAVTIFLRAGTYYLDKPLQIGSDKFDCRSLLLSSYTDEKAVVSGGQKLKLQWKAAKNGIMQSHVETTDFDVLFINGKPCILARYPNYTENVIFNGTAEDALSPARVKRWKHPEGGFIHAMHGGQWGAMHYVITGKKGSEVTYEGGWQNNRPSKMHQKYRFVENIFEELDSPGEWYCDKQKQTLYYMPREGEDLNNATFEAALLPHLIELTGSEDKPLRNISIQGLQFALTCRTFMKPYEPLMRSDWRIYRGAAVMLENTEDCTVSDCEFADLGGNALFISRYNLCDTVRDNYFHNIGASAVCLVGDTSAVRLSSKDYSQSEKYKTIDIIPGPANNRYPRQCTVEDNLIRYIGQVEKQVAGVEIQLAAQIHVSHNTICHVPRAGINVGDGAFGGHLIEYNDVFETVLETSDHGAFNSWGRDRYWNPNRQTMDSIVAEHPELILLDALYTTVIRNNRFRCDHGWDIDLDDGSSNYHIYNNVCLSGGLKLREGFYRTAENNIMINNSFHPHVWFVNSGDVFQRNIVMRPYYPISLNGWGKSVDYNFFLSKEDLEKSQKQGTDKHSIFGSLAFADAAHGDYTLTHDNAAFAIGFENFPMDRFGVYSQKLKLISEKPAFPELMVFTGDEVNKEMNWFDAKVRAVRGLGDRSVYGLPDESGIIVVSVKDNGKLSKAGIRKGDVIRKINGQTVATLDKLSSLTQENRWKESLNITVFRDQTEKTFNLLLQ